jgi:hypothetical protein
MFISLVARTAIGQLRVRIGSALPGFNSAFSTVGDADSSATANAGDTDALATSAAKLNRAVHHHPGAARRDVRSMRTNQAGRMADGQDPSAWRRFLGPHTTHLCCAASAINPFWLDSEGKNQRQFWQSHRARAIL